MTISGANLHSLVRVFFGIVTAFSVIQLPQFWVRGEDLDWTTLQPEFQGADPPPSFIKQLWSIYNLIPYPLRSEPEQVLEIEYANRIDIGIGRFLFPLDLRYQPTRVAWPKQYVNSYYTLIMTDLDWPSDRDRSKAEYLHWLIGNIRGPPEKRQNETIAQYIGPKPRQGSGLHRYIYYLFRQSQQIEYSREPKLNKARNDSRRERFSMRKFSNKYNLGEPVAVTFWLGQFWHYNSTI